MGGKPRRLAVQLLTMISSDERQRLLVACMSSHVPGSQITSQIDFLQNIRFPTN